MKLIAIRSFRNSHEFNLLSEGEKSEHEFHVPKGAIFSIGADNVEFKNMRRDDQHLISLLSHSKAIGDATDTKLVARIKKEVAAEKNSEEKAQRTAVAAGSSADVVKQLVEALKGLVPKAEPAK